jgi:PTH1 family peptidyl-tRNA hydrolase
MSQIALIAGLGNPGPGYKGTRHNAGFWFIEELSQHYPLDFKLESRFRGEVASVQINGLSVRVLRPGTFMNESGQSIVSLMRYFAIEPGALLVVHDDLDLEPGVIRLKEGGGHGGHNGLRDLIRHLDSNDFVRLRLGIGHPGHPDDVTAYVLHTPPANERSAILDAVYRAVALIEPIINGDHAAVMNELHRTDE